jgi:hypothetical protein
MSGIPGTRILHAAMFSGVIAASGFLGVAGVVGDMPGSPYAIAFLEQLAHAFVMSITVIAIISLIEASGLQSAARAAAQLASLAAGVVASACGIAAATGPSSLVVRSGLAGADALRVHFLWMGFAASVMFSWYYASRERALGSIRSVGEASRERHATIRRAGEARLRALRAQVDPDFLDSMLVRVDEAYRRESEAGDRLLDEFIDYLSGALRDSRDDVPQDPREAPWPNRP